MDEPQQRAANLRATALASGVALAVVLPLAVATAGQDGRGPAEAPGGRSRPAAAVTTPASPERPGEGAPSGASGPSLPSSEPAPAPARRRSTPSAAGPPRPPEAACGRRPVC